MASRLKLKLWLPIVVLAALIVPLGVAMPGRASAATPTQTCSKPTFFGLEPWYQYLDYKWDGATKHCEVSFPSGSSGLLGKKSGILLIVLAVVDDLLRVAGIVAVFFVIIGGFKFITAQGEPEAAAGARKTLTFALIGLVVALMAVVIVSFIGNTL